MPAAGWQLQVGTTTSNSCYTPVDKSPPDLSILPVHTLHRVQVTIQTGVDLGDGGDTMIITTSTVEKGAS